MGTTGRVACGDDKVHVGKKRARKDGLEIRGKVDVAQCRWAKCAVQSVSRQREVGRATSDAALVQSERQAMGGWLGMKEWLL